MSLHDAARHGDLDQVKLLIESGKVDVNAKDISGLTPLHWAVWEGYLDIVKCLVESGEADVNAKDKDGWTPLHWAAQNGFLHVTKWLVETGSADVVSKTPAGWSPLHRAAVNGHFEMVKWLVESGMADTNAKTEDGRTACDVARTTQIRNYLKQARTSSHRSTISLQKSSRAKSSDADVDRKLEEFQRRLEAQEQHSKRVETAEESRAAQLNAAWEKRLQQVQESILAEVHDASWRKKEAKAVEQELKQLKQRLDKQDTVRSDQDWLQQIYANAEAKTYFIEFQLHVTGTYMAARIVHSGLMDPTIARTWATTGLDAATKLLPRGFDVAAGVLSSVLKRKQLAQAKERLMNLLYGTTTSIGEMETMAQELARELVLEHERSGMQQAKDDAEVLIAFLASRPSSPGADKPDLARVIVSGEHWRSGSGSSKRSSSISKGKRKRSGSSSKGRRGGSGIAGKQETPLVLADLERTAARLDKELQDLRRQINNVKQNRE